MPARDTPPPPKTGTSVISGRVTTDSGSPVRRAAVQMFSAELRATRFTTTDGDGRYEFRDLPAGDYVVSATKAGFIRPPSDFTSNFKVGNAAKVRQDIVLVHACAIAGRIVDEYGDPVPDVSVRVIQRRFAWPSGPRLTYLSGAQTNDLGQYRVYNLQPGNYYVAATSRGQEVAYRGMNGVENDDQTDRSGYAATYYPGTANLADAMPVHIAVGQDATNADFALVLTRTARVSGSVVDSQGRPATRGSISFRRVLPGMESGGDAYGTSFRPDGTFVFSGLAPGEYVLSASISGPMPDAERARVAPNADMIMTTLEAGLTRVTVVGSDVSGVTLQMSKGASVSGEVIFDGVLPAGSQSRRVAVQTIFAGQSWASFPGFPGGPPPEVRPDNSFSIPFLFGPRLFRVAGLPAGWALKSVVVNGRDVTDTPINFEGREQITGMQIVVTDRITKITGSVTDAQGQPVHTAAAIMVLAQDSEHWAEGSRYVTQASTRDGPFKIDGLPPGDYFAVAIDSATMRAIQTIDDVDPRELLRKAGTSFSLGDAETKELTLKLMTGLPERK